MGIGLSRIANYQEWFLIPSWLRRQRNSDQDPLNVCNGNDSSLSQQNLLSKATTISHRLAPQNVLVEIIGGNRREFEDGLDFIIDEITQEAPPLADDNRDWYRSSIMRMRSTIKPELIACLDSELVATLICQLEIYCSPENDLRLLIKALKVMQVVVNLCSVFQNSYGPPSERRFTEDHLVWLCQLWLSHEDRDVLEWIDKIMWKLWYLPPYNNMLVKVLSTHFKETEKHIIRYAHLSLKGPYLCDEISPIPSSLDVFPKITRNLYRALIVVLNCWRLCENRPNATAWCSKKCKYYLDLIRQILSVKYEPACVGRVLRSATYAIVKRPVPKPEFYPEFKNLFNYFRNNEPLPSGETRDISYYLKSTQELRTIISQPENLNTSSSYLDVLRRYAAMFARESFEPLRYSDMDLFSPPSYVTAFVKKFTDQEVCFEPDDGWTEMIESIQHCYRSDLYYNGDDSSDRSTDIVTSY